MAYQKKAPFRANHVGSLLRPPELRQARDKHEKGEISAAALREVEDRCIRDAVKMQEDVGMQGITDGEFRRTLWNVDFLRQIEGVKVVEGLLPDSAKHFQNPDADVQRSPTQFIVTGKLRHSHGIEVENFKFLASVTKQTAKQCIPSPSLVHFRTGRGGVVVALAGALPTPTGGASISANDMSKPRDLSVCTIDGLSGAFI